MNKLEKELNWLTFFITLAMIYQAIGMIWKNITYICLATVIYLTVFIQGMTISSLLTELDYEFEVKNVVWGVVVAIIVSLLWILPLI